MKIAVHVPREAGVAWPEERAEAMHIHSPDYCSGLLNNLSGYGCHLFIWFVTNHTLPPSYIQKALKNAC